MMEMEMEVSMTPNKDCPVSARSNEPGLILLHVALQSVVLWYLHMSASDRLIMNSASGCSYHCLAAE